MIRVNCSALGLDGYEVEVHATGVLIHIDEAEEPHRWLQVWIGWEDMEALSKRREQLQVPADVPLIMEPCEIDRTSEQT